MKKRLLSFIIMMIVCSLLFAVPTQAVSIDELRIQVKKQAGSEWVGQGKYYLGSYEYWRIQTVEKKTWTGETRPEALMGDASLDGKVNAEDALFALYFGLYGNCQTGEFTAIPKTPPALGWKSSFESAYHNGSLEERAFSEAFCWQYCRYNSPFLADVTKDCVVNAKDALEILKYSVGKAKDFPVGDFTTINWQFCYYPWPDDYYPGIFEELCVEITDEEFREKYGIILEETLTDI